MRFVAVTLAFALLSLGFAPAPFPKAERRAAAQTMAGAWDVKWGGMDVRLDLRPDGSARFEYANNGGTWDGRWRFDKGIRRVTLTLFIGGNPSDYVLAFSAVGRDAAEGVIQDSPTSSRPLKLARSGRK
jgi:hypothetical protein